MQHPSPLLKLERNSAIFLLLNFVSRDVVSRKNQNISFLKIEDNNRRPNS